MDSKKASVQIIWGALLALAGGGVLVRVYTLEETLDTIANQPSTAVFIRLCLYIMAAMLIGGGVKKIYTHWKYVKRG
ncbi:MAG: hypothetical protein ACLFPD_01960 [Desulfosudaceae bacterium]